MKSPIQCRASSLARGNPGSLRRAEAGKEEGSAGSGDAAAAPSSAISALGRRPRPRESSACSCCFDWKWKFRLLAGVPSDARGFSYSKRFRSSRPWSAISSRVANDLVAWLTERNRRSNFIDLNPDANPAKPQRRQGYCPVPNPGYRWSPRV